MNVLRIGDAFDQPRIEQEKLEKIVAWLNSFDAAAIRSGPGYHQNSGLYTVRLSDHSRIYNPKDSRHRPELIMTETDLYAVQAHFSGLATEEAVRICRKLEEAGRRIDEARDYVAEMRSRPLAEASRRRMV
jgi:hypothetical protein